MNATYLQQQEKGLKNSGLDGPEFFRPSSVATAEVAFRTVRIIFSLKLFQSTVQIHESHIFTSYINRVNVIALKIKILFCNVIITQYLNSCYSALRVTQMLRCEPCYLIPGMTTTEV